MMAYISICRQLTFTWQNGSCYFPRMSKAKPLDTGGGSWVVRDIPRDLMHRVKIAAAVEHKSVKQWLMDLSRAHLEEMEKKGLLPKGK